MKPTRLIELLRQARAFQCKTVNDSKELARWHREVDAISADYEQDNEKERYDAADRTAQRERVTRLFYYE